MPSIVIVRAYGDEPVLMEAVETSAKWVAVRRQNGDGANIRFPYDMVFEFSESSYRRLAQEYANGERERLADLWRSTTRLK